MIMAAEVLTKTNLFSSSCNYQNQHPATLFPKTRSSLTFKPRVLKSSPALKSNFLGRRVAIKDSQGPIRRSSSRASIDIQMSSLRIGKAQRWWEKGLQPNMRVVSGAEDLVDSLLNAGDKLVVVDFFSPGCGGCKALHPKLCQIAGLNPDVQFLQVNYEEHKSMCYSLNVHVLPFFRFYRGAHGRVCSFSCTNATIKKFKDALAKHTSDRCSIGPTKGLEEKELVALSSNRDLKFSYTPKPVEEPDTIPAQQEIPAESSPLHSNPFLSLPLTSTALKSPQHSQEKNSSVAAGR